MNTILRCEEVCKIDRSLRPRTTRSARLEELTRARTTSTPRAATCCINAQHGEDSSHGSMQPSTPRACPWLHAAGCSSIHPQGTSFIQPCTIRGNLLAMCPNFFTSSTYTRLKKGTCAHTTRFIDMDDYQRGTRRYTTKLIKICTDQSALLHVGTT